ncbi:MAG TPA: MFS transporter [Mesotoga sp.]|nr:MFS transporter [Mesotoga sp.]MDD4041067.1 MFS transporter [Mesotoga sp.]HOY27209.1 MFS transporter [Mesotoga sp.]HPI17559.1 MFS transporter [Mesotoga sp.]HPM95301.1 MFS transporter [Mesotoga sp.]
MDKLAVGMEKNIRRNYVFSFFMNLRLSGGLWMIYMAFKGMSLTQIGLLEGIFHVTSLAMEVPTGSIADLFGRKLSRTLGRCMSLASILILIVSSDFTHFLFFMVFSALSYNLESGSGEALVYDSLKYLGKSEEFMRIAGKQEAVFQCSSIAAFLVGGLLGTFDYHLAFWVSAAIIIFTIGYSLLFVEPPIDSDSAGSSPKRSLKGFARQIADSFSVIAKTRKVAFLILFTQTILAFCTCIFFYMQNFWKGEGMNEFQIGVLLAIGSLAAGVTATKVHKLQRLLREKMMLILLPLAAVISMWALALSPFKAPFFILISMFEAMLFVASSDYINRLIPSQYRATIISFSSMAFSVVMIAIFPSFGKMADAFSFGIAFISLAAVGSLLYGLNMWVLAKLEM